MAASLWCWLPDMLSLNQYTLTAPTSRINNLKILNNWNMTYRKENSIVQFPLKLRRIQKNNPFRNWWINQFLHEPEI